FLILPLVSLAVQYPQRYRGRAAAEAVPENVAITNIYSQGFSVSWTTAVTTTGYLAWGATVSALDQTQGDDRAVTTSSPNGTLTYESKTHHVTVAPEDRPSSGEFFFTIHSGTKDYGGLEVGDPSGKIFQAQPSENGATIRVPVPMVPIYGPTQDPSPTNTPGAYSTEQGAFGPCPTGELDTDDNPIMNNACFRPYPIWGQVFESNFSNPINGALVYVRIFDSETGWGGDPKSSLLSAVANEQGLWSLELANALDYTDLTKYLAYQTDLAPTGGNQTPDKLLGLAGDGRELTGDLPIGPFTLHRVTDTTSCTNSSGNIQRNTCADHDRCAMELPSPICINIGGSGPTPTVPPTPTPIPPDTTVLQLTVKLQGNAATTALERPVTVKIAGTNHEFTEILQPVGGTGNEGRFVATINLENTGVVGTTTFKIKAEGYLQKIFETSITADQLNETDWTSEELLAGDFNGDNKLTLDDFTGNGGILRVFGETISIPRTVANEIFDLNGDQKINVVDVSIVLTNFSGVEVPGED
ncbi:hypothetical protein L6258_01165, partial [Candidatus Parcubacteria bacterium]|nr:hypothetical protein [Candidatus Parcubacteria bacterium]